MSWIQSAWGWLSSRWNAFTGICLLSALALGVVVLAQWSKLHHRRITADWGSVPEWVAAFGTVAAFGALLIASRQWRDGQSERKLLEADRRAADKERRELAARRAAMAIDDEMSQARLIVVEPLPNEQRIKAHPAEPDLKVRQMHVRNYSGAPVFDLKVSQHPLDHPDITVYGSITDSPDLPSDLPVLRAKEATATLTVAGIRDTVPTVENVAVRFTDARGLRWQRIGPGQPKRLLVDDWQ